MLMRYILENSKYDFIPLEKEIQILENYLEIQKLRFETDFDYSIDIDNNIDKETCAIPPMLAQPFIENSVEHGILPKKGKGKIRIRYSMLNNLIRLEIEDNGVGRNKKQLTNTPEERYKKRSLSVILTQERIGYLKKASGRSAGFEIIDLTDHDKPAGTKVVFTLPFQKIIA